MRERKLWGKNNVGNNFHILKKETVVIHYKSKNEIILTNLENFPKW